MSEKISFDGQVVVITGAAGSLGRAYALDLARRGAAIVANDIPAEGPDESPLHALVARIESEGGRAIACEDSVATPEGGAAIIERAVSHFGTVDAVVHNAGNWRHVPFEEMTADQLDPVLDVHLRGAFFVTRPAWVVMKEKGYGRIVLTSSSAGAFGREWGANYAAAKAGMLGLARALALEGGRHGIQTNCLLPIARQEGRKPPPDAPPPPKALVAQMLRSGLKGGFPPHASPEQVAPILAWLASRACSVNGEAFSAGCGRFARVFTGLTEGWLTPDGEPASPDDIGAHLEDIERRDGYTLPAAIWEELRAIGMAIGERDGIDPFMKD